MNKTPNNRIYLDAQSQGVFRFRHFSTKLLFCQPSLALGATANKKHPNEALKIFDDIEILPGWDELVANYFIEPGKTAEYEYDFGDSWHHEILFEGILLKEKGLKYPVCIDG